jgi:lipopolysaccharide export system permease protein
MKTVRRLLYSQILSAVLYVTVAFLALFFFFDLVEELQRVTRGTGGYSISNAVWACVLSLPIHLYDVFPITLLIGAITALARLAQSSEFTILRTAGLGPGRALGLLGMLGVAAMALTFALGEWAAPWAEHQMAVHKASFRQGQMLSLGRGGAWLREAAGLEGTPGHQITVNVGAASGENHFQAVRIFEFDAAGRLVRRVSAKEAAVSATAQDRSGGQAHWRLQGVEDTRWAANHKDQAVQGAGAQLVQHRSLPTMDWTSQMSPQVVSASVLPIDTMSTMALWRYMHHLERNDQAAQKYELQFWKKAFAPLGCLVMVSLALPFAYLQARSGGMTLKIFGGVMLGISYVLVNHITSHLGLLHQWQPWLAASAPSLVYTLLALTAFVWLVRNR